MRRIVMMILMIIFSVALILPVCAEVSSVSVEEREKEISELIKDSIGKKDMRPEATIQLQNPAVSSLAQPTVSTLAQPHETLSMSGILDLIKTTTNIVTPDENLKSE
jgi:hypothetical protein